MLDRKTGEKVHFLFAVRAGRISKNYINDTIIPALCRKAGIPAADVRGPITSHRARSTIATQLYNAKEPMTLFELQAWLGHRSPESTQHYAKITPNTLAKAYNDAGYFARNVRTIEVLVDRDAVANGAATAGEPWQHYDLGHGFCSYTFFEQCPHRMACARCDFYIPKESSKSQLLQAKSNLQRMLVEHPAHRRRTNRRRRRSSRPRPPTATPRRHPDSGRDHTTTTDRRHLAADRRRQPRPTSTNLTIQIPQNLRAGRDEMPLPGDPIPGPDRCRQGTMDDAVEASAQRVRNHLR